MSTKSEILPGERAPEEIDAPRSSYVAIFVCTVAMLMLEILLTRIFSFTIWYHLAYVTISTALLSFGAAGSLLAAFPSLLERHRAICAWSSAGAALSTIFAIWYLGPRPLDPIILWKTPVPFFLGLLKYYFLLSIPFLFGGMAISATLSAYPRQVDRLYASDLAGAAVGCMAAVTALHYVSAPIAIMICAVCFMVAAAMYADKRKLNVIFGLVAAILIFQTSGADKFFKFMPTPSKNLAATMSRIDFTPVHTQWSPVNRVDVAINSNERGGFWAARTLDVYTGELPRVMAIQYDAHNGSHLYNIESLDDMEFLDYHPLEFPYEFHNSPRVLVIGVGGGVDVLNALRNDAVNVDAAELQPITVELLKNRLDEFSGGVFNRDDVNLVAAEGRHFVRAHDAEYDHIQITATDTFSAQATGAYVLAESYLYTVEAFQDYFEHLSDDGTICVVLGDINYEDPLLPRPLASRILLTARKALENLGVEDASQHMFLLGAEATGIGGNSSFIVIRKSPFTAEHVDIAERFAERVQSVIPVGPGIDGHAIMTELVNMPASELDEALAKQEFHLRPATDDRPFFYHILFWDSLWGGQESLWYFPGSATGQLMLLIMLVQALLVGGFFIFAPLMRKNVRGSLKGSNTIRFLLYFLALGVGFMLIEISLVQKYVLFLGYPTYSLSVTIVSLLVFAALGAALSRAGWANPSRLLMTSLGVIVLLVIMEITIFPPLRDALLGAAFPVRVLMTIALQCPVGLALGVFFPTGINVLYRNAPGLVPWAWACNGIGSVVSTVLAVILGMAIGFSNVALVACAIYLLGTLPLILGIRKGLVKVS